MTPRAILLAADPPPRRWCVGAWDGPNADRVARWAGLEDKRALPFCFDLWNVYADPGTDNAPNVPGRLLEHASSRLRPLLVGRVVVLLGCRLSKALGVTPAPFFVWRELRIGPGPSTIVSVLPHPCGLTRAYNAPATVAVVSEMLTRLAATDGVSDARGQSTFRHVTEAESAMNATDLTDLWDYERAAQFLSMTPGALRVAVCRKQVPHVRLGKRKVRFRPSDLALFVQSGAHFPTG